MEVLPPPQTTSEVSAPTSREAYTRRSRPWSVPASASFQRDFIRAHHITAHDKRRGREKRAPVWLVAVLTSQRTPYTWMRSPSVAPAAGVIACTRSACVSGAALKPLLLPRIVPQSFCVLYAP